MYKKEEGKIMEHNHPSNEGYPKIKIIRYIIPLLLVGVVVGALLLRTTTITDTLTVIESMPLWLLGLAVFAQVCSYLGSGFVLSAIMKLGKSKLSTGRGALITMAAASIGLIAGGWVSSSAATYFWVSKNKDAEGGIATLTGILPGLYNMVMLIIVTVIGMIYLLLNLSLSKPQIINLQLNFSFQSADYHNDVIWT